MRRHLAAAAGYAAGYGAVVVLERALARVEEQRGAELMQFRVEEGYLEKCSTHGVTGCECPIVQFVVVRRAAA